MIQVPQYCIYYTKNENMNKTCKGKHMCKIYYDELCKEYTKHENNIRYADKA